MYEIKQIIDEGFFVWQGDNKNSGMYLHKDYIWRKLTRNGEEYTGYFKTRKEAELALFTVLSQGKTKEEFIVLKSIYRLSGDIDRVIEYAKENNG